MIHAGHGRSIMNSVVGAACAEAGFVPRVRHEVEETSTLVTLVAAGLGVAIVPAPTASLEINRVCYRALLPPTLGVDLVAARAASSESPIIARMLHVLHTIAGPEQAKDATLQQ